MTVSEFSSKNRIKEDSVKSYDHINDCYNQALSITDPDLNNGELSIDFPEEIRQSLSQTKDLDSMPILSVGCPPLEKGFF